MKALNKETRICSLCKDVIPFNSDRKGKYADNKKWMFILHAADSRVLNPTLFGEDYETALGKTNTGKILSQMFNQLKISIEDVYITNAIKCLPVSVMGKDRRPRKKEYENCGNILRYQIKEFQPQKIIVFGAPAYATLMQTTNSQSFDKVKNRLDQAYNNTPLFVMNHPGNIWWGDTNKKENHYVALAKFFLKHK